MLSRNTEHIIVGWLGIAGLIGLGFFISSLAKEFWGESYQSAVAFVYVFAAAYGLMMCVLTINRGHHGEYPER